MGTPPGVTVYDP